MPPESRLNPDEVLAHIQKGESKRKRGQLKIFFGMCPGVGKTYAMLEEAQLKKKAGIDVLVGYIETHQRVETENLLKGLEVLNRKKINYRQSDFEEFDVDAVLKIKPQLVIIDELAHTNVSGSRHLKRYQDIEEILNHGIDVFTTLNVQHIESRAHLVFQITGTVIRETVPDSFIEKADQIELVDITSEELLKRLQAGQIYIPERAEQASLNFFKSENITALRELALRFTAEKVDSELNQHLKIRSKEKPWNTNERMLVAIGYSPSSAELIRNTRRLAFSSESPWIALYIDNGEILSAQDEANLKKNLSVAKELGAEVLTLRAQNKAQAIKNICLEKNVTQVILGRSPTGFLGFSMFNKSLLNELIHLAPELDVHVFKQTEKMVSSSILRNWFKPQVSLWHYWFAFCCLSAMGFLGYLMNPFIGYKAVGFVFLLSVLIISNFTSLGPLVFSAIFSALSWNFFFIPPELTFEVGQIDDVMMLIAFFAVALVTGYLARRSKKQEEDLLQRERRAQVLYEFSKELSEATGLKAISEIASQTVSRLFNSSVGIFLSDEHGVLDNQNLVICDKKINDKDFAVAHWAFNNQKKAGWKTETLFASRCLCLPLKGRSSVVGILMLFPKRSKVLSLDQENLLETIVSHLAIAIERENFEENSKKSELLQRSEKLHQAILNSISHEMRTPLTSILGTATTLSKNQNSPLVDDLLFSVDRLNHVIENLLDMSRINSGILDAKSEIFEANDFVKSTLNKIKKPGLKHKILFSPSQDIYLQSDERFLEHVLLNLIDNAMKYSPEQSQIQVKVESAGDQIFISVHDQGSGIAKEFQDKIFEQFYRVPGTGAPGTGLGLVIARAFTEAAGGALTLAQSNAQGSVFRITLPIYNLTQEIS